MSRLFCRLTLFKMTTKIDNYNCSYKNQAETNRKATENKHVQ